MSGWGSEVERERKRRIDVAAWAYAYEVQDDPIVDDATFDRQAALIRPDLATGHPRLDAFFRTEFSPHTGQWIHRHPERHKLARMCALRRQRRASQPSSSAPTQWAGEQGVLL